MKALEGAVILALCTPAMGFSEGDGWKIGVTVGTCLAALIFFAVLGFLLYYLCVRKIVRQKQGLGEPPPRAPATRHLGYSAQPAPVVKDYRQQRGVSRNFDDFEKEPSGALNHSTLTSSSYNSGPLVTNHQTQEVQYSVGGVGAGSPSHHATNSPVTRGYRQTTTTTTNRQQISAAYIGSSV